MAISITKSKKAVEAEKQAQLPKIEPMGQVQYVDPATLTIEELADRYGMLEDKVAALKLDPAFTQFEEVAKKLAERLKEFDAQSEVSITGTKWLIEAGACSKNPRKMKDGAVPTLRKMLGDETFTKLAKINIGDIDKYCTPDQVAQVLDEDTGYSDKRKIVAKHLA